VAGHPIRAAWAANSKSAPGPSKLVSGPAMGLGRCVPFRGREDRITDVGRRRRGKWSHAIRVVEGYGVDGDLTSREDPHMHASNRSSRRDCGTIKTVSCRRSQVPDLIGVIQSRAHFVEIANICQWGTSGDVHNALHNKV